FVDASSSLGAPHVSPAPGPQGPPTPAASAPPPQAAAIAPPVPGSSSGPVAPSFSAASDRAAPASVAESAAPADPTVAPEGRPIVLAAGRLAAQKDFGVLLEAAAAWRDLDPPPLLVIAGDGPLAGKLRAQAAALGVAGVSSGTTAMFPRF